jgi:hypothetical protein
MNFEQGERVIEALNYILGVLFGISILIGWLIGIMSARRG